MYVPVHLTIRLRSFRVHVLVYPPSERLATPCGSLVCDSLIIIEVNVDESRADDQGQSCSHCTVQYMYKIWVRSHLHSAQFDLTLVAAYQRRTFTYLLDTDRHLQPEHPSVNNLNERTAGPATWHSSLEVPATTWWQTPASHQVRVYRGVR